MAEETAVVAVETTDDDFDDEPSGSAAKEPEKKFTQADLDQKIAERITRERAKFADYADLKKKAASAMTEQERAVAEAEQRGRSAALATTGVRLARTEIRAEAAEAGLSKEQVETFFEWADLKRFVTEDGEPDSKAIRTAIKKLSGSAPKSTTNYDGGARTPADKPTDMNALIRQSAFGRYQ